MSSSSFSPISGIDPGRSSSKFFGISWRAFVTMRSKAEEVLGFSSMVEIDVTTTFRDRFFETGRIVFF
jgi:hypothetical protein